MNIFLGIISFEQQTMIYKLKCEKLGGRQRQEGHPDGI